MGGMGCADTADTALPNAMANTVLAIGGQTDEPPPDLSPQQVNTILRTNETTIGKSILKVKLIECNQLASNHPIEDRIRISTFHFPDNHSSDKSVSKSIALAGTDEVGAVESVKAASEIFTPVSGRIAQINDKLEDKPGLVNSSCYDEGWLFKIKLSKMEEWDQLMDEDSYQKFLISIKEE
ncbi:unnamed protein product [Medioppia subpectinata]|uniref:Glycine cleavage system H protein n=1 Tax=Medioppia subpectinata TaxID=1979941 RepID=A0A7R9Q7N4_9ACAR|nr:unnamed protein product [Medioppia subpectinata]CAG2114487.1 unnamed protein product [Medioppia subpectinata]